MPSGDTKKVIIRDDGVYLVQALWFVKGKSEYDVHISSETGEVEFKRIDATEIEKEAPDEV